MRILHVIHDFVPNHVGGSELYCYYLCGALAARGHAVDVYFTEFDCSRPQYSYTRSTRGALTCHEVVHNHEYRSFQETYLNPHMDERFERLLDAERPDVVHLHHVMLHSLNYPKLARRRGVPVVFTLHDYWLSCLNYGQRLHPVHGVCDAIDIMRCADCVGRFPAVPPFAAAVRRLLARTRPQRAAAIPGPAADRAILTYAKSLYCRFMKAFTPTTTRAVQAARRLEAIRSACRDVDLFLAPSQYLARRMIEFGLAADRVVHSPNGMRTDLVQVQRRLSGRQIRFGYVGAVVPHKGVHVLVEAFSRLAARSPERPIELRIHGNLGQRPDYVAHLRRLAGTAPVRFLGEFDNVRLSEVYSEIDALVIPSLWWENAPLTLFEARLAGKPVMVSDAGSLPDLIHGAHDTTFRTGDADDLARCLAAFIDRPRLVATATTAHRGAVRTIAQNAQDLEQRYADLLEGASSPSRLAADDHP
jgi:glycosyltransferase involved in cell wall biosynthesis